MVRNINAFRYLSAEISNLDDFLAGVWFAVYTRAGLWGLCWSGASTKGYGSQSFDTNLKNTAD